MNFAEMHVLNNLGWTLIHSLWQIALVAVCLWILLNFAARASANMRYLLACLALCLALILPSVTYIWLADSAGKEQAQIANSEFQISDFKSNISEKDIQNIELNGVTKKAEVNINKTSLLNLELGTWNLFCRFWSGFGYLAWAFLRRVRWAVFGI